MSKYSNEFKIKVVNAYLLGEGGAYFMDTPVMPVLEVRDILKVVVSPR